MWELLQRRRRKRDGISTLWSGYLFFALAVLIPNQRQSSVEATNIGSFLDPEVHVTRATLVNRGLKNAGSLHTSHSFRGLKHALEENSSLLQPSVSQEVQHQAQEAAALGDAVAKQQEGSEPDEWVAHFQRRRLQQAGSFGGSIVAISPSGAPLLRQANRNIPTVAPAGGVGEEQELGGLSALPVQDSTNIDSTSTSSFLASRLAPAPSAFDDGACNTLAYRGGYASFRVAPDATFRFTSNKDQCCELCEDDPDCVAWSRVAGGQSSVRTCYLMNSLNVSAEVPPPAASAAALPAFVPLAAPAQAAAVQTRSIGPSAAVGEGGVAPSAAPSKDLPLIQGASMVLYVTQDSPLIIESGTKSGDLLPPQFYGCPYPPSQDGGCTPPASCNCYGDVCYGSCQGNELMEAFAELAG